MIKNLLITYLFLITNVFAGLPPTTVKGQAEAVKTTTFNVEVPYSQATTTAAGTRLLEVGNNNILANGSFEHSTYDTGWTCSLGTKTKETTTVFKGKNSMKIVSAGAGTRCYIYSTTDAAKLKGQQGHATVRVNSTDSVLQVCALAGGTTSAFDTNCVTVPVTTTEAPWKTIVIPTIMDGTGNGVVIKSAETLTKSVFVDEVEYKHGLPVQSVNGARLLGAVKITGCANAWTTTSTTFASFAAQSGCSYTVEGGALAPSTNIPAIKFASLPAGDYRLEYEGILATSTNGTSGVFQFSDGINTARESSTVYAGSSTSQSPGLQQSISYSNTQSNITLEIKGKSVSGSAVIYGTNTNPGVIKVWYFPPVSTIYSQASRDFGYTNAGAITITATTTNPTKGTVVVDRVLVSRKGQRLNAIYQYEQSSANAAGSGDYLFDLPSGLSFDSNIVSFITTSTTTSAQTLGKAVVGEAKCGDNAGALSSGFAVAYSSTKFRIFCSNIKWAGTGASIYMQPVNSSWYNLNSIVSYSAQIDAPIQGWTDSSVIVGSFQGYNETPGTSRVETFSVSYGTTNATTVCSASPCSYLDQIGNAVTSVTRSSQGVYVLNLGKSYSKAKCAGNVQFGSGQNLIMNSLSCSNCSTLSFTTVNGSAATLQDTFGTLLCQGIPQ